MYFPHLFVRWKQVATCQKWERGTRTLQLKLACLTVDLLSFQQPQPLQTGLYIDEHCTPTVSVVSHCVWVWWCACVCQCIAYAAMPTSGEVASQLRRNNVFGWLFH